MEIEVKEIDLSLLEPNKGQIEGLPKNPRLIKDARYKKLVQSLKDSPEFIKLRELIVYPFNGKYVVIAGNQRLSGLREIKAETAPCKILPIETTVEKLKEYTIKDNVSFGEMDWEIVENEWNAEELEEWGELVEWNDDNEQPKKITKEITFNNEVNWYITVKCKNEKEAQKLYEKMLSLGHDVKILN